MESTKADSLPERNVVLTKAVIRVGECLGLRRKQVGAIIGLSPSTMTRMYAGTYYLDERDKSWELAALLVRLYRGLDAIMAGDERSVQAWMGSRNNDLHGTPAELVGHVTGLTQLVNYVDAHRARV